MKTPHSILIQWSIEDGKYIAASIFPDCAENKKNK
jgi:hypothetical protein